MVSEITERPKALLELLAEIDQMDETLFTNKGKVEEGETIIGEMSPWMCKALALSRHYYKLSKMLAVENDIDSAEQAAEHPEITEAAYKSELLKRMVWFAARAEFNAWNWHGIGSREGCKLVGFNSDPDDFEQAFMKMLKIPRRPNG